MNQYTQLLTYLKWACEQDEFVNTVTRTGRTELDLQKANIFPLVDVYVTGFSFPSTGVMRFNVQVVCVTQRDNNKEIITDKFWGQDNEVDNMNLCAAIINRLWVRMHRDFDENNITASDNPNFGIIDDEFMNNLDGWGGDFDVDVPNTTLNLCDVCN